MWFLKTMLRPLCLHKYLTNWDVSPVYKGLTLTIILPFEREIKCVIKKYQADTKYLWSKAQVLICTRCLWKMHIMSKDPVSCQSWGYRNPSTTKKSPIVWNTVIQKVNGGGGGGSWGGGGVSGPWTWGTHGTECLGIFMSSNSRKQAMAQLQTWGFQTLQGSPQEDTRAHTQTCMQSEHFVTTNHNLMLQFPPPFFFNVLSLWRLMHILWK